MNNMIKTIVVNALFINFVICLLITITFPGDYMFRYTLLSCFIWLFLRWQWQDDIIKK